MEGDSIIFHRAMMAGGIDGYGVTDDKSVALGHIHGYYKEALHRLPPELIPSLLEAGFCFGFLDPVSNIIANTISHDLDKPRHRKDPELDKGRESKKRSRDGTGKIKGESRRKAISKIITGSSKKISLRPSASDMSNTRLRNSSIAARSLRGLVTFLTAYFRHLTTWDALRYLRLSNADLLVAVHLIQEVRDAHTFAVDDPTAQTALRCAAIIALHPAVDALVSQYFLLASRADEGFYLLEKQSHIGPSTIEGLSELLTSTNNDMTNRGIPMQQAITRLQKMKLKGITRLQHRKRETFSVGAGLEISLKMVLLDKIHLLYLKAISCLPKDELCSHHHRGLLKAGHCYGPFDPVTNIILNTIWYDTMFRPKQHFEVAMICTKSLARMEFLSLCGLVAYICVCFPAFSVYEAMRRLLICNASLYRVIKMAKAEGHHEDIHFCESVAYDAASRAAHHPSPAAFVEFATTVMPQVGGTLWSTPEVNRVLSSCDVHTISETLSQNPQVGGTLWSTPEVNRVLSSGDVHTISETLSQNPQVGGTLLSTPEVYRVLSSGDVHTISKTLSQNLPPIKSFKKVRKLSGRATKIISANRDEFKACQGTIVKMVEAALHRYAEQQGQEYELHFICDVNSTIPKKGVCYCPHSYSYPISHMNILAKRRGPQNDDADQVPTLFFIQCSDERVQGPEFICCPISDLSKEAGRCRHCEYHGIKIIHPSSQFYLGRCTDFEEMARGENGVDVEQLVVRGQRNTLFDGTLKYEDSIYFDPAWDVDFSIFINQTASDEARREIFWKEMPPERVYSWLDNLVREQSLTWRP